MSFVNTFFEKSLSFFRKIPPRYTFQRDFFLIVVIFLFLQYSVDRAIGLEAALGDSSVKNGSGDSALVCALAYVRAVCISALTHIGDKLGEGRYNLLKREEIKSGKVDERKAGGIGKEAGIGAALNLKYLNVARGVSAALDFA